MKSPFTQMKIDRVQVHRDINAHRPKCNMDAHAAIKAMWELAADAYACDPNPNNLSVAVWAWDILQQQGCEHYDTGIEDTGLLVDLISVIVRG